MRITTELELRTIDRYRQARNEYRQAKLKGRVAFKSLMNRTFSLIPKGARDMIKSIKLNAKKSLPLPPSLPSGGATFKRLDTGMYMTERQKAHQIYLLMQ